jgi:hypothetical protein
VAKLSALPSILLSISLLACTSAQAKPKFNPSEVAGPAQQLLLCDLDGDGVKDLVLMDDLDLSVFYQASTRGLARKPQQTYRLMLGLRPPGAHSFESHFT